MRNKLSPDRATGTRPALHCHLYCIKLFVGRVLHPALPTQPQPNPFSSTTNRPQGWLILTGWWSWPSRFLNSFSIEHCSVDSNAVYLYDPKQTPPPCPGLGWEVCILVTNWALSSSACLMIAFGKRAWPFKGQFLRAEKVSGWTMCFKCSR